MTAQTKAGAWIIGLCPPALFVALAVVMPDFVRPFWTTGTGRGLLTCIGVLLAVTDFSYAIDWPNDWGNRDRLRRRAVRHGRLAVAAGNPTAPGMVVMNRVSDGSWKLSRFLISLALSLRAAFSPVSFAAALTVIALVLVLGGGAGKANL